MKIKYQEYLTKTNFNKAELLAFSWGHLIEDPPQEGCGMLPAPPMLMFDRVTTVEKHGNKGKIVAEQDLSLSDWFFQCHFRADPVQPGCLGIDAVWQLIGFYATLCGAKGAGRALGAKEINFFGQIRPHNKIVTYEVMIKRFIQIKSISAAIAIGSANVFVDQQAIYVIKEAKVGIFTGIQYDNYPHLDDNAIGGSLIDIK
jgi:3-hydroxyacyl-[acyl-carrier protein] dehydratase / trans-2-decenoyl-[acyl-carrier protein] isomerase